MQKVLSPLKAIRAYCRKCKGNNALAIENCDCEKCPLHIYRFGKKPNSQKREYTEEEREAMRERMRKMREARGQ